MSTNRDHSKCNHPAYESLACEAPQTNFDNAKRGMTKPTYSELETSLARVRGLLQRADEMRGHALVELSMMQSDRDDLRTVLDEIVEKGEKHHYAPTLSKFTGDGMLCNVIDMAKKALEFSRREPSGAESADIGKLDTVDEDENVLCAFCPTRSPDGSMKACIDAGKCLHPDKPVGHFAFGGSADTGGEKTAPERLKDTVSDSCMDGEHEGCDWGSECDCGCHDEERATA